jgi:P27 family predicted phage terminase small subunit
MTGRPPKALTDQIAAGDPRKIGKKKLQQRLEAIPKATHGLPPCPRHLRGRARARWNYWKQELEVMELDAAPDDAMLEGACVNYAKAVQADAEVLAHGVTVEEPIMDAEGKQVGVKRRRNPADVVSNRAWSLVKSFCSEFGLSPVSRTRLAVEKPGVEEADLMTKLSEPRTERAPLQ